MLVFISDLEANLTDRQSHFRIHKIGVDYSFVTCLKILIYLYIQETVRWKLHFNSYQYYKYVHMCLFRNFAKYFFMFRKLLFLMILK